MDIRELLEQNAAWAREVTELDRDFFHGLYQGQSPEFLWIGCSDARVPATTLAGMLPGDIFVHRNIANVVVHTDLNCLSVIQFAVEVLKVKHIIVCGHYGCGGVKASMENRELGLIDNWLCHIKDVHDQYREELAPLGEEERFDRLCELNVVQQVANVSQTPIVQAAWRRGQPLEVHGLIYRLKDGILKDLSASISGPEQLNPLYRLRPAQE